LGFYLSSRFGLIEAGFELTGRDYFVTSLPCMMAKLRVTLRTLFVSSISLDEAFRVFLKYCSLART
jgi:hypothetical protein